MARKTGQIIGRAPRTWVVRVYVGRDAETKKRKYLNKTIHGGLRDAQAHLNRMLGERDLGRNLDSSKQTLNQYLDRWLEVCAKPRLRAKSIQDYQGLLRRNVRLWHKHCKRRILRFDRRRASMSPRDRVANLTKSAPRGQMSSRIECRGKQNYYLNL